MTTKGLRLDSLPEEWKPSEKELARFLKNCTGSTFRGKACVFWTSYEHQEYFGKRREGESARFFFHKRRRTVKQISYVWTHGIEGFTTPLPLPTTFSNTCLQYDCINGDHLITTEEMDKLLIEDFEKEEQRQEEEKCRRLLLCNSTGSNLSYSSIATQKTASNDKSDDNFFNRDIKKIKLWLPPLGYIIIIIFFFINDTHFYTSKRGGRG